MKIGLVGATNQEKSLPFNAERMVNLFAVQDQSGKESAALYGTPGLREFVNVGTGPIRGQFIAANGEYFVVSGNTLYEVTSTGVATSRGTFTTSSGIVTIDENGTQLAICDSSNLYIFTYSSDAFATVTLPVGVVPEYVCFMDGYFIVNDANTGKFYISSVYDGITWNSLDFASAESKPDNLLRPFNGIGQLWLFGVNNTEIWNNTGNSTFPFQRISGGTMPVGILAPLSAKEIDNTVFWVGKDLNGRGIVYRANGFTPVRISTHSIETKIQAATNPENINAYVYQQDGHIFYCITGGSLETTLVYNLTTQLWHEWAYLSENGTYENHLASDVAFVFGEHIAGSRITGQLYYVDSDYQMDGNTKIKRTRVYTHICDEQQRLIFNKLIIGFETGVGNSDIEDPQCSLRLSKDGGRTWSSEYTASIGQVGEYGRQVSFRRLGMATILTFELSISSPCRIAITGSYLS